ncbi:hypothetical protein G8E10_04855 [Rhizobiaceae bacterium CRRU44]|uniref:Uncharacterized protein n=1 Tax=Ferranicluibacter rubi TaxID=2715133 RepID=A0AA43ZDD1_9HYPH|nr:hypothetical protein [Ferranicluibacter rubi]NHT75086.1 hypothetical protein [Ferranicluibacter rubi]
MTDIKTLLERAESVASKTQPNGDLLAVVKHAASARQFVWDQHYASSAERALLDERLAASAPEFQAAVAATERALSEELTDSSARRARIRAENPQYFKEN